MNSKIKILTAFVLISGVIMLMGAGCVKKEPVSPEPTSTTGIETPQGAGQEAGQNNPYNSAEEIAAPTGLASELKSIFSEACGGAKLTTLNYNFLGQGFDMLVYVWKNKPTEEKLISVFEKNGYEIEESGTILLVKKKSLSIQVDWSNQLEEQQIVVLAGQEE